ncbi:sel1 repeat family protein [Pseudomonas syringae]|nr:sel1 repeat family protein [Pseudomonas syringae]MCF5070246.1 sel1 repeat family protein [Pseudomonas syringae]
MILRSIFCFLIIFTGTCRAETNLSQDQLAAKERGIILYNQLKSGDATPYLTIAAQAGDREAQYYLAETLRKKNHFMNSEARKWYEAAASQEDIYAMIQLGRSENDVCDISKNCPPNRKTQKEWLKEAKKIAEKKASNGNAEAMYIMYELTYDEAWLQKSASNGYPLAQYWIAKGLEQGEGFFLPWNRSKTIEKWFKASAEGGNPRSMMAYAAILYKRDDVEGYRYWNEQAALAGYANTVFGYGCDLAHEPDTFGYPLDLVKGYALIYLLTQLDGGGGMQENVNEVLPLIEKKMTTLQILEAKKFAKRWGETHPPLSFFPDKLNH